MRWPACGLVGLLVFCGGCASGAVGRSATASVETRRGDRGVVWRKLTSRTYATASVGGRSLLLEQTLVRFERSDLDDDDVTLTSAVVDDTGERAVTRWSVVDHAVSGRVAGDLFITHLPGLDTSEAVDRYYALASGRFLFATTDVPVELPAGTLAEAHRVAYLAAAMPEAFPCNRPGDLGALLLVGAQGVLQTLVVTSADRTLTPFDPAWGVVDPRSGAVVKGLPNASGWRLPLPAELRLAFDGADAPQVRVPLGAHGFDVDRAVLAPGFGVERRDCAGAAPAPHPEAAERHRVSRGPWAGRS